MKWKLNETLEVEFYDTYSSDHLRDVKKYLHGYLQAIEDYSIWKNGENFIGALNNPKHIAFAFGAYNLDEVKMILHKGDKIFSLSKD